MYRVLIALAAWLALSSPSWAAPPAPLSSEVYGRLPSIELMALSPSGEKLAYVSISGDSRQVVVKDLADKVLVAAPVGDSKIRALDWAGDDHLLITASATQALGSFSGTHEFDQTISLNLTTNAVMVVFSTNPAILHSTFGYLGAVQQAGHWYGFFEGLPLTKTRGFDSGSLSANNYVSLYRVELDSGVATLAASGAQRPHDWALDTEGTIVAHSEYVQTSGVWTLHVGDRPGAPLVSLTEPLAEVNLRGLGRTPGTVLVDKATPEEWSLADGSHAPLVTDRLIAGYIHDPATGRLVGVWPRGDRPEQQFFEPRLAARQAAYRKALGGDPKLISWSDDYRRMILFTEGDTDPGTYWLVDGKSVRAYAYPYPEIPDVNLGPTRVVSYKAADGLEIHGVLTLPPGREAKGLPLVVLPHGGPQGHDNLGFDWQAQAFASRGYAVFQPNFRGSDDQGLEFRDAGFGEWGRKMQTDISDGVADLARQGLIDPKRACIVGGSYGGYAALAGVTVQQGLYRCAVSYGGISDLSSFLFWLVPADGDDRTATARYERKFIGAKANDDPALRAISPAQLADRADAPILLIHGADDTVVPIAQSLQMQRALQKAGKPVDFLQLKGEDHWLSRDASRKAMLAAAIAFVERYNPVN
ncbi:S9 family peptidase [Phenylobacterium aquaticum]|uniref:alpha/beta hydrolase family protein n=1 Tax=Phenylobacterium aquaticum TaxID=1763816 RepID=UPI0026EA7F32|nr:S9 family peptidase [Phenylobacterium aquaticum]